MFNDESEQIGLLFAAHAGVAMAGAQKQQQLAKAMSVRDLIGQAKGNSRWSATKSGTTRHSTCSYEPAKTLNTKLVDVARYLVDTGELADRRP